MPGAKRLPGRQRVQLPPWNCQDGDTITLYAGSQRRIEFEGGISRVTIQADGGEIYYAVNDALATVSSPGYIPDGGTQIIGPVANLNALALLSNTDSTKAHLEICRHPGEDGRVIWNPYVEKVLSYGPIAYWPLWETAGVTAECLVNSAMNGTYARNVAVMGTGAGIGDGYTAPDFDGVNDWVNIWSAALAALFNGSTGSAAGWAKVSAIGVWTDGTIDTLFQFRADNNNYLNIRKRSANTIDWVYRSGGAWAIPVIAGQNSIAWMHWGISWDRLGSGNVIGYLNGAQSGGGPVAIGAPWVGAIINTVTNIGSTNNVPTDPWNGSAAHIAVWNQVLTPAQFADLATV